MELATNQIYSIFAMLTAAALAGMIFYCLGLRTGRAAGFELGRTTAARYYRKVISKKNHYAQDLRRQLDTIKREASFSAHEREGFIQELQQALAEKTAQQLGGDDLVQLGLVAKQLGISAKQHERSGSTKANQAALARDYICDLARRVRSQRSEPVLLGALADSPRPPSTWECVDEAQLPGPTAPMCM